jgi:hypothetical protein
MSQSEETHVVHGRITGSDGHGDEHAEIVLSWQHIRSRIRLGATRTGEEGRYRILYEPPHHPPGKVLLVVEARLARSNTPLQSGLIEARPELRIDLSAREQDNSEWTALVTAIRPLLDGLEFSDLMENDQHHDLSFLARELQHSTEDIMRVVVAERLTAAHDGIPPEVFWAFLRQRVPAALPVPLLEASQGFALIEALVSQVASIGRRADACPHRGGRHRASAGEPDTPHRQVRTCAAGREGAGPAGAALPGGQDPAGPAAGDLESA